MDPILGVSYATVASFMESAQGNYRNAFYVTCSCDYTRESGCGDFLFIPGFDCKPVILPVTDAEAFLNKQIDQNECAGVMSSRTFIRFFHKWIELTTSSAKDCPIQQLLHQMNQP